MFISMRINFRTINNQLPELFAVVMNIRWQTAVKVLQNVHEWLRTIDGNKHL